MNPFAKKLAIVAAGMAVLCFGASATLKVIESKK